MYLRSLILLSSKEYLLASCSVLTCSNALLYFDVLKLARRLNDCRRASFPEAEPLSVPNTDPFREIDFRKLPSGLSIPPTRQKQQEN